MRTTGQLIELATPFVWLGLGLDRIVFRALNLAEITLAGLLTVTCAVLRPPDLGWALLAGAWALLAIQVGAFSPSVGPPSTVNHRRSDPSPVAAAPHLHRSGSGHDRRAPRARRDAG